MDPARQWHPILAAHEVEPGEWVMIDPSGTRYAIVRLMRLGDERGYRAVTWAAESAERRLLGYWTSLRAACAGAHRAYLAAHGPGDFAGYPSHLQGRLSMPACEHAEALPACASGRASG